MWSLPTFVGGLFFNATGMSLEDHAADKAIWQPGGRQALKGTWETEPAGTDGRETLRLTMSARVFGVEASKVQAEIQSETVRAIVIHFSGKGGRAADVEKLRASLRNNIGAWGATAAPQQGEQETFRGRGLLIHLEKGSGANGEWIVRLEPVV